MNAVVEVKNLTKEYKQKKAVDDLSFEIRLLLLIFCLICFICIHNIHTPDSYGSAWNLVCQGRRDREKMIKYVGEQ